MSRFLEPLSKNEYTILNTSDLIGRLRNEKQIPPNYALVSFDVQSLFTNVPLNRTLDIIMERIYKNNDIITDIPSKDLKDLLLLCTKQVHFQYDGSNYLQSEGVAMGSPLGPILANIFLTELELNVLPTIDNKIINWKRYVDDTLAYVK